MKRILAILFGPALIVAALALMSTASSCKIGCAIETPIIDKGVPAFVDIVECSNPDEVKKDVTQFVKNWGLCKERELTRAPICSLLWGAIVDTYIAKPFPKNWGTCKASNLAAGLKVVGGLFCSLIPG